MCSRALLLLLCLAAGCESPPPFDGSPGGGTGGSSTVGDRELPCEVTAVLEESCDSCHGPILSGGAPFRIVTRADLAAYAPLDQSVTVAERALLRMRLASMPMPPLPAMPVGAARVAQFEHWVMSGMPAGSCAGAGGGNGGGAAGGGSASGSGGGAFGAGGGAGGGAPVLPYDGGVSGLPCDVAAMVASKCAQCHRTPPAGNATFALLSRADFLAQSAIDPSKNQAQRALARLTAASDPMPPTGYAPATSGEVAAFSTWVNAGTPAGSCGPVDAGSAIAPDAGIGPQPTTCASNSMWTGGDQGNANMNPGLACKQCHLTRAFLKNYQFMGTVFPSLHEKNLCNAVPPAGAKIEIIDKNGAVAATLTPESPSGNFHSAIPVLDIVAVPYTARITANGVTASMMTPQTTGDCNTCHTEQGANGAPGRLVWPH